MITMRRLMTTLFVSAILLAAAAATHAEEKPPPTPIPAPQSANQSANPAAVQGSLSELPALGSIAPQSYLVPGFVPGVSVVAPMVLESAAGADLSVPIRLQAPGSVECGVASLGMAFDFYGGRGASLPRPATADLAGWMRGQGVLYNFGTGVEEMAWTARNWGYAGSYFFSDWTLERLGTELGTGRPVVAALKLPGNGEPAGHFVTVTGVSADGRWVTVNDPAQGAVRMAASEFMAAWKANGARGVVVSPTPIPSQPESNLPLFGGLSVAALAAVAAAAGSVVQSMTRLKQAMDSAIARIVALANDARQEATEEIVQLWESYQAGLKTMSDYASVLAGLKQLHDTGSEPPRMALKELAGRGTDRLGIGAGRGRFDEGGRGHERPAPAPRSDPSPAPPPPPRERPRPEPRHDPPVARERPAARPEPRHAPPPPAPPAPPPPPHRDPIPVARPDPRAAIGPARFRDDDGPGFVTVAERRNAELPAVHAPAPPAAAVPFGAGRGRMADSFRERGEEFPRRFERDEFRPRTTGGTAPPPPPPPPAARTAWTEQAVNTVTERGIQQGHVDPSKVDDANKLARQVVEATGGQKLSLEDLAAIAQAYGVNLQRHDPSQLRAALNYINAAPTAAEQQERLRKTLINLQVVEQGLPRLDRQELLNLMWEQARVPSHAVQNMSAQQLADTFQQVVGALGQPGQHQLKIGKHNLKMTVSADNQVTSTETKKPGFLDILKKVGSIALAVASVIPSPIAPFAKIASAVINAVQSVRSGSVLGAVVGIAGAVAAGAGAFAAKAGQVAQTATQRIAGTIAQYATAVKGAAQGVQMAIAAANGGGASMFLRGVAGVAGAVAGVAGGAANTFNRIATWAGRGASGIDVVSQARRGDILGAVAGGASLAGDVAGDLGKQNLASTLSSVSGYAGTANTVQRNIRSGDYFAAAAAISTFASTQVSEKDLAEDLKVAGSVLTHAGQVQDAIKNKDWLAAAAGVAGMADDLTKNGDVEDASRVLAAASRLKTAVRSGNAEAIALAAKDMYDAVKTTVENVKQRHFPPPVVELPVSQRDFSDLLNVVPGLAPAAIQVPMQVGRFPDLAAVMPGVLAPPAIRFSETVTVTAGAGPLGRGAKGPEVRALQEKLILLGYGNILGEADGDFGPKTEQAVRQFQWDQGLSERGVVGPETLGRIEEVLAGRAARAAHTAWLRSQLAQQIRLDTEYAEFIAAQRGLGSALNMTGKDGTPGGALGTLMRALERARRIHDDPRSNESDLRRAFDDLLEARNVVAAFFNIGINEKTAGINTALVVANVLKAVGPVAARLAFSKPGQVVYSSVMGAAEAFGKALANGNSLTSGRLWLSTAVGASKGLVAWADYKGKLSDYVVSKALQKAIADTVISETAGYIGKPGDLLASIEKAEAGIVQRFAANLVAEAGVALTGDAAADMLKRTLTDEWFKVLHQDEAVKSAVKEAYKQAVQLVFAMNAQFGS